MTSIAFPVIGTGKFGFPHATASNIMLQEAVQFCQTNQSSSIKDVRFVVYKKDQALITAFKQEMAAMQGNYGAVQPATGSEGTKSFPSFGGINFEVKVIQGDITKEETEAIVNINSLDMDMHNAGALSEAIAKASGSDVENECKNMGRQVAGAAVMTSGGNLAAFHIIHSIPGSARKQHLQQCVENCLRKADASGLQSISLPAFGTGMYGMSAQDSAELTFQALDKFCPTSQHVRQVNIVIFKPRMLQTFTQEQQKRAGASVVPPTPRPVPPSRSGREGGRDSPSECTLKMDQRFKFCVLGKDEERTKKAVDALKKGLSEACTKRKIPKETMQLLTREQISRLGKQIKGECQVRTHKDKNSGDRWILGSAENVRKAVEKVEIFVNENRVREREFKCLSSMRRFLVEQGKDETKLIEQKLKQFRVKIKKSNREEDLVIEGTKEGLARAHKMLALLTNKLNDFKESFQIQQPGLRKFLTSGGGDQLVRSVERDQECVVDVKHKFKKEEKDSGASDDEVTVAGSSTLVVGSCKISWKTGDITKEQVRFNSAAFPINVQWRFTSLH